MLKSITFFLIFVLTIAIATTLHMVPEGFVGIYYRGGKLTEDVVDPGFHAHLPFVTQAVYVQTTMQTDRVVDIACGTKSGVVITFDRIEVVNFLRCGIQHH